MVTFSLKSLYYFHYCTKIGDNWFPCLLVPTNWSNEHTYHWSPILTSLNKCSLCVRYLYIFFVTHKVGIRTLNLILKYKDDFCFYCWKKVERLTYDCVIFWEINRYMLLTFNTEHADCVICLFSIAVIYECRLFNY